MKKRILITGAAGFVGSHCVGYLLEHTDWDIIVIDALTYAGDMNRVTESEFFDLNRITFFWHDLRAPISENIHKLLGRLDYCIHFAAESHVDRSLEESFPFVMSNVVGTANLLEYFKKYQPQCKTLIFSTDEVFGAAPDGVFFKEDDPFRPSNPYSASKAGEEMIAYSLAHAFDLPISIVRSMNIIGERQHSEKFVPKTIKALLGNEKVVLHGKAKDDVSSRGWIHARNVADALFFLLDKAEPKEFYHITGEERTVLEMANWICQVVKARGLESEEIEWHDYDVARRGHDKRYALSGEKLEKMGWHPPVDLEDSLKETIRWTLEPQNQKWLHL